LANQDYTNVFVDVHNKVRAFKDRLREVNKGDAALREDRLVLEAKQISAAEPASSRQTQVISKPLNVDLPSGEPQS
jgi:hypothetical protein